ncbi:MAG TPA: hypothetical protein VFR86_03615 [Burkholderiaceae bacterium]|nr:hypothetical protein [Burkholderiaceae bacterium]
MFERAVVLGLFVAAIAATHAEEIALSDFKLGGYYKNLLVRSETVIPPREPYTLDLNRLRLEVKGRPSESIAFDLQYDNEILLGSYLQTSQFAIEKERPPEQYWKAEANYAEGGDYYGRHRLYRANVTLTAGATDMRIGRQRIAWGTGRFWSPLDLLNPFSPIAIEREERVGVDAVLIEHKLGALSRVGAVYAPRHDRGESSAALLWHHNIAGIDYSIVGGRFRRENVAGLDVATQISDAGIRGELTYTERDDAPAHWRAVAALDYAFANTLTLSGELYYNGAGATDPRAYDFPALLAGRIQNVARRYFGGYAAYEITPLVEWRNYVVINLADDSWYFSPALIYSAKANVDLTLGVQWFRGRSGSEYALFPDLYFAALQWFF